MRTSKDIADANDLFRMTMITGPRHKVILTPGVSENKDREQIITCVRNFKDFEIANDPFGEHDFGTVLVNGESYYFKMDYYDKDMENGADPYKDQYTIVLTIMRSDEY